MLELPWNASHPVCKVFVDIIIYGNRHEVFGQSRSKEHSGYAGDCGEQLDEARKLILEFNIPRPLHCDGE